MEGPEAYLIRGSDTRLLRQALAGGERGGCGSSGNRWQGREEDGEARGARAVPRKRQCQLPVGSGGLTGQLSSSQPPLPGRGVRDSLGIWKVGVGQGLHGTLGFRIF